MIYPSSLIREIATVTPCRASGYITGLNGSIARASLPSASVGELVRIKIDRGIGLGVSAEILSFDNYSAELAVHDAIHLIRPGQKVYLSGQGPRVQLSSNLLGCVLNSNADIIHRLSRANEGVRIENQSRSLADTPPPPMQRARVTERL